METKTTIPLVHLAHTRSGDKGDTANVGVIAYDAEDYQLLREALTVDAVREHFGELVEGEVERFELPNLHALNFLLHGALGGGGTVSLMTDAQGKVFSSAILRMEIAVPSEVAERVRGRGRTPPDYDPEEPVPLSEDGEGNRGDGRPSPSGGSMPPADPEST